MSPWLPGVDPKVVAEDSSDREPLEIVTAQRPREGFWVPEFVEEWKHCVANRLGQKPETGPADTPARLRVVTSY